MGKNRDYTKYSKETVEPVEQCKSVDTVVSIEPIETVAEDICPASTEPEPNVEAPKYITGIVTDCTKLNVREDPYSTARILGTITADTELIINEEESTTEFYKIYTASGIEGYCMKKFITILP